MWSRKSRPETPSSQPKPGAGNLWGRNGGIYLGYEADQVTGPAPALSDELSYDGDRHIVTIGPNGSGKSRRLLKPNLARLTDWSMLVVDPKAELAFMTASHRSNRGNNVILLNPFNLFGLGSHGFNPIMALDPGDDDFPDDALSLADAVIKISPDSHEPHWAASAQDLVSALIMYARLSPVRSRDDDTIEAQGNFGFVRKCLGKTPTDFRSVVVDMMRVAENKRSPCEELYIKAARFIDIDPDNKELNSIISTALTQTRWLDSPPIKKDLAGPGTDFSFMKDKPTTVFLNLPARRIATQSPWLRLIIAAILQKLMKDASRPKVPTLLMLDEFAQLGHLSSIENNMAVMRGYGLKLWAVFQDLSQAQAIYGKRWESFMGNSGVLNSFAPQDVVTADYLSSRTGFKTVPIMTSSSTTSVARVEAPELTINHAHLQRPLMYPQDLRDMADGYMVYFSHQIEGTMRCYLPFKVPGLEAIDALDPA